MRLSIIVPIYDDDKNLKKLQKEFLLQQLTDVEMIVIDGLKRERPVWLNKQIRYKTCDIANRGQQLKLGASLAYGDYLWFLHVDSRINFSSALDCIQSYKVKVAFFSLAFDNPKWRYRLLALTSNLRAKYLHLIFGDQGLVVTKKLYVQCGGFRAQPIMEDWQLSRSLAIIEPHFVQLPVVITTSARRFEITGFCRTMMRMHLIKLLYILGVSPKLLLRIYQRK